MIHNYRPVNSAVSDDMAIVFRPDWHELLIYSGVTQGSSCLSTQFRFPHKICSTGKEILSGTSEGKLAAENNRDVQDLYAKAKYINRCIVFLK